jgi:hypothetical protein
LGDSTESAGFADHVLRLGKSKQFESRYTRNNDSVWQDAAWRRVRQPCLRQISGFCPMSLLGSFRADQLITQLAAESKPDSPAAQRLVAKLKSIGPKVIPKAIDALAMTDKSHTMLFVDILASMVSDKTLPAFREGLAMATNAWCQVPPGRCPAVPITMRITCSTFLTMPKFQSMH